MMATMTQRPAEEEVATLPLDPLTKSAGVDFMLEGGPLPSQGRFPDLLNQMAGLIAAVKHYRQVHIRAKVRLAKT